MPDLRRRVDSSHGARMNSEYLWWLLVLVLVGAGAVAYLALGPIPDIEPERDREGEPLAEAGQEGEPGAAAGRDSEIEGQVESGPDPGVGAPAQAAPAGRAVGADQSDPVSTVAPGSDDPASISDTP